MGQNFATSAIKTSDPICKGIYKDKLQGSENTTSGTPMSRHHIPLKPTQRAAKEFAGCS
jgi:hypothetical protein